MTQIEFNDSIIKTLDRIRELFTRKNLEYKTEDPLANFTTGGRLLRPGLNLEPAQYEALKAYLAKHVAQVYNQPITEDTRENWSDVAVYSLIALAMLDAYHGRYDANA